MGDYDSLGFEQSNGVWYMGVQVFVIDFKVFQELITYIIVDMLTVRINIRVFVVWGLIKHI